MAKRDDTGDKPTKRTYKASDVHKRRVGDSARPKAAKMPSRREARESARETMRINTATLAEKSRRPEAEAVEGEPASETVAIEGIQEELQGQGGEAAASAVTAETSEMQPSAPTARFGFLKNAPSGKTSPVERPRFVATRGAGVVAGQNGLSAVDKAGDEPSAEAEVARTMKMPAVSPAPRRRVESAQPVSRRGTEASTKKRSRVHPATVVAAIVVIALVVGVAFFAFNRWGRYDDRADLQGTWYVLGTDVPVSIDGETIRLSDDVAYRYTIDDREKTISYTFGPMSGQGRYWFSPDRKHLVITDGDGYTAASTTFDDLLHAFLDFSTATGGGAVELPSGEGIIAFSRSPEPIVTNQPAEGLVVPQNNSAQSSSASSAAAEAVNEGAQDGQAAAGQEGVEPGADQAAADQSADNQATGEQVGGEQGYYEEPYYEQPADQQPAGDQSAEEQQPSNGGYNETEHSGQPTTNEEEAA